MSDIHHDSHIPLDPRGMIIPLLPLRDIIVFPHLMVPLFVGREKSIAALNAAMTRDREIFLVAQKNAKTNEPTQEDIYTVGTISTILQMLKLPDGTVKILVEGKKNTKWWGRSRGGKLVFFEDDGSWLGRPAAVRIERASPWALQGILAPLS